MISRVPTLACSAALAALAAPSIATAQDFSASYFLPRATVVGAITQTLLTCPSDPAVKPQVETVGVIVVKYGADPDRQQSVRISTANLWVGQDTTLKLRADGTLESFSSTSEGAGGAAVAAIFKAVSAAGTIVLPPHGLGVAATQETCKPEIRIKVEEAARLKDHIAGLEVELEGQTGDAAVATRLKIDRAKTRLAAVREDITLSVKVKLAPSTGSSDPTWEVTAPAFGYDDWFLEPTKWPLPGAHGFVLRIKPNAAIRAAVDKVKPAGRPARPRDQLAYLRPIPAAAELCIRADAATTACSKDEEELASTPLELPQISPLFYLPVSGGVFANRTLTVAFSESGAPTAISYKSKAQIAEVAAALTGAGEAVQARRDADQAERERRLKALETRVKIREAEAALATALAVEAE